MLIRAIGRCPEPSAFITHNSFLPVLLEMYKIDDARGEYRGCSCSALSNVSCTGFDPSWAITQIWCLVEPRVELKTMCCPSGDHAGCFSSLLLHGVRRRRPTPFAFDIHKSRLPASSETYTSLVESDDIDGYRAATFDPSSEAAAGAARRVTSVAYASNSRTLFRGIVILYAGRDGARSRETEHSIIQPRLIGDRLTGCCIEFRVGVERDLNYCAGYIVLMMLKFVNFTPRLRSPSATTRESTN